MAIPFYEPKNAHDATGDQVDGQMPTSATAATNTEPTFELIGYDDVDYEAPTAGSHPLPTASTSTPTATTQTSNNPPNVEEQLIAWKILALAMCKVLKQYYLKHGHSKDAFSSTFSVHLIPNGKTQPKWK